ncbi:MAG TPA: ferritin-like domain-containing protein [Bdellovibrionales bacterium]|nr:ferritin-like domain-containing protein [Bdellovibrionales bacterium]
MKTVTKLALALEKGKETDVECQSRRLWLKNAALASASGLFMAACGRGDLRATTDNASTRPANVFVEDAQLLNAALALEHEAIALYSAAATLPFMQAAAVAPILSIAGTFLQHHISHRDSLIATINGMQVVNPQVADPVVSLPVSDYVAPVGAKLTDVVKVVQLASLKEMEACKAYLSLIKSFKDPTLARTSGMLGGDEAAHYGALRAALFAVLGDTSVTATTVIPSSMPTGFQQNF